MSRHNSAFGGSIAAAHETYFARLVLVSEAGTTTSTPAVLHRVLTDTRGDNRASTRRCRFTQLTAIRHDAIVTVDGLDWQIDAVHSEGPSGVDLTLVRTDVHEAARGGYRK